AGPLRPPNGRAAVAARPRTAGSGDPVRQGHARMNRPLVPLDAETLLRRVAERVPKALRPNIVVIGSIATAWAFRDVARTAMVATKDIDLLLQPSVDAVSTAEALGAQLLSEGWTPRFPNAAQPCTPCTPDQDL